MATITIDGKEYDLEKLSPETQAQIQSLQFVEAELIRLQAQIAIVQTARIAYQNALKNLLTQVN